jgi:hypothetical protein
VVHSDGKVEREKGREKGNGKAQNESKNRGKVCFLVPSRIFPMNFVKKMHFSNGITVRNQHHRLRHHGDAMDIW